MLSITSWQRAERQDQNPGLLELQHFPDQDPPWEPPSQGEMGAGARPGICRSFTMFIHYATLSTVFPLSLLRGNAVGEVGAMTQRSQFSSLSPLAEKSIPLRILYDKYCECLTESNLIKVRGLLIEPAANSYLLAERDIYLENPEIKIRVRDGLGEGWWQGRVPRTARPRPAHVQTSSPAPSRSLKPRASSNPNFIEGKHRKAGRIGDSYF